MSKKHSFLLVAFFCLVACPYGIIEASETEYCAFCDQDVLCRQKFYEDDLVLALYTHKPIFPGHCLIIPKRHVKRFEELTDAEVTQIGRVIKQVNQAVSNVFHTAAYLLLQKNGEEVGQTVPHVHFHYIPREAGDDSAVKFILRMYLVNAQSPLPADEIQLCVEQLRKAMPKEPWQDNVE